MRFKAVFLDAGETMIHPHPSFPELFSTVLEGAGHRVDLVRILQTVTVYSQRWTEAARRDGKGPWSVSRDASRDFWLGVYRGFLTDVGVEGDTAPLAEELYSTFSDPANYRAYPDVLPALEALRDRGYTLGLISNFEEWLELVLEAVELTAFFPVRVISGIEGVEKPDERIFRIALDRAGADAETSVYVGDHPDFDVEAARAVGMFPVLVDRRGRYPDGPEPRVETLHELAELLEKA
ncbi:MAG: HAD-IA family hydrolase [Actinobacteria bacterium]|nr:HAD-IA family hydrolase [Actinomycetota bacterium]